MSRFGSVCGAEEVPPLRICGRHRHYPARDVADGRGSFKFSNTEPKMWVSGYLLLTKVGFIVLGAGDSGLFRQRGMRLLSFRFELSRSAMWKFAKATANCGNEHWRGSWFRPICAGQNILDDADQK